MKARFNEQTRHDFQNLKISLASGIRGAEYSKALSKYMNMKKRLEDAYDSARARCEKEISKEKFGA